MKEAQQENFRWAAHTSGTAIAKPKDYEPAEIAEAASPYAAWKSLQEAGTPLRPGDLLESLNAEGDPAGLMIAKYIGFEKAEWWVPEPKQEIGNPVAAPDNKYPDVVPAAL